MDEASAAMAPPGADRASSPPPGQAASPQAPQTGGIPDEIRAKVEDGTALLRQGLFAEAADLFGDAIAARPDWPMPYNNLAVALRGMGRLEEALLACAAALRHRPDYPEAFANLARILLALGRYRDAAIAAEQAARLRPDHTAMHALRAMALLKDKAPGESLPVCRTALALDPAGVEVLTVLAQALDAVGRPAEALSAARRGAALVPSRRESLIVLGSLLTDRNLRDEALAVYRRAMELDPNDTVLAHLVHAIGGTNSAKAPEAYVANVFDSYADRFDEHLVKTLQYKAHEIVAQAAVAALPPDTGARILDIGCGTGLCGPTLRPAAARLVGVDLSARMLDKARDRNLYDALARAELVQFMAETDERFDAIVSADVLCYFGDLTEVFRAAAGVLEPGGLLAFTVERQEEPGYRLTASGRYVHGLDHLRDGARGLFRARTIDNVILRTEASVPVHGYLCVFQRLRHAVH
ncbi:tetratricopeptide repeat protein [Azospirillum sp. 412522]|nr:methyltransferase domain-containing protein [Azospirillum sp. 412522]MBY6266068.1 tetratricopeptide repeat protein [Azospirillum sp. 412522]